MTPRPRTIPTLDQYISDLLQQRRSDYLAELEALRKQFWHKNWLAECSQILTEIHHLTDLPLMTLMPSLDSFCTLAKIRSRYNRDVTLIVSASGINASKEAKQQQDHRDAIGHALNRLAIRVVSLLGISAGEAAQTHSPGSLRMS